MTRVAWLMIVLVLALTPVRSEAAHVALEIDEFTSPGAIAPAQLRLVTPDGPVGPGEFTITLEWGAERTGPEQLGAISLQTLPTPGPLNWLVYESDCTQGLHQLVGSCTMTFSVNAPVNGTLIADLAFRFQWVPAEGYEMCEINNPTPECTIQASDRATIIAQPFDLFGEPQISGLYVETGTFVVAYVRTAVAEEVSASGAIARVLLSCVFVALGSGIALGSRRMTRTTD